ncbi:MAG: ABC transporter ATP-binding protein [Terriglobales bacterium]
MSATAVIELSAVCKSYGERFRPAVQQLSFRVEPGEILGFIGPNGAGKTTTILMIAGLLLPSAGTVRVLGRQVRPGLGDTRVGVVSSSLGEFDYLTGQELLLLSGRLLGLTGAEAGRRTDALIAAFDLGGSESGLLPTYSAGMKQKIRIACALIGSPKVLLLDEPFESLDVTACALVSALVQRFAQDGGAALLASHDLHRVERLATHYAILQAGQLQELAPMHSLAAGAAAHCAVASPALEQRFWSVTGVPEAPVLDWLHPSAES